MEALGLGVFLFKDGIDISNAENVIVDHCSVSWTLDEGVNTYHGSKNITIQWCLISDALHDSPLRDGHGFAASLGGKNSSYHHNLFANNAGRNPRGDLSWGSGADADRDGYTNIEEYLNETDPNNA